MKQTFVLVLSSLAALQGCDVVEESDSIPTDELFLDVQLNRTDTAETETLDVRLDTENDLYAYDSNVIQLTKEDTLTVYVDGESHTPVEIIDESEQDRDIYYRVELPTSQGSTEYRVALIRQNNQDAPDSRLTVMDPPPFTTVPDQVIRPDETLVVTWTSDNTGKLNYTNTLDCTDGLGGEWFFEDDEKAEDNGTFILDNRTHFNHMTEEERQSINCDGTFQFAHFDYSGEVDPSFSMGSFRVYQIQTLTYQVSGSMD